MADVFKRKTVDIKRPITADMCLITWEGAVTTATNLQLSYQQQVTRRRTLGTNGKNVAVIYPGMPVGQITIARLFAEATENLFERPGWNVCDDPATIYISFSGQPALEGCSSVSNAMYVCRGCIVTNYTLSAEAEGLQVVDNITIEFLQMDYMEGGVE